MNRVLNAFAWLLPLAISVLPALGAPPTTVPAPGLRENTPQLHALVNARLVIAPDKIVERGTLVVRDGSIISVGENVNIPRGAKVWDLAGKTVYPGLIDAYNEITIASDAAGAHEVGYWNSHVVPQRRADLAYRLDKGANDKLRRQGVTARVVAPASEIIRGTSVVVLTGDDPGARSIVRDRAALHLKLSSTRNWSDDAYPNSHMGAFTLVRQAFYDARWHQLAWKAYEGKQSTFRPEHNLALEELQRYLDKQQPVVVDASDWLYLLRAHAIGKEFDLNVIVRGAGDEYRRVEAVKNTGRPVILPVDFPKAPNVAKPEQALSVSLETLMHWDLAPENPARLDAAGVRIAFTSAGLKDVSGFLSGVRKAVERGLTESQALRALTITPAELFGVQDRVGTLDAGKIANLIVTDGPLFDKKTKLAETWVDGRRYEITPEPTSDPRGTWEVKVARADGGSETVTIAITGEATRPAATVKRGDKDVKADRVLIDGYQLGVAFKGEPLGWEGVLHISFTIDTVTSDAPTALGHLTEGDGSRLSITARRTEPFKKSEPDESKASDAADDEKSDAKSKKDDAEKKPESPRKALFAVNYPLGDFGLDAIPEQPELVLFQNAKVWTCAKDGVLEKADVLVEAGKIKQIAKKIKPPKDAQLVDCEGKHLSPGMIDCHSHIATDGGVNESGQTITAEVRIGDFIDPIDINIYRQLAGGTTSSHIMHGSSNTIGGQCQVVKFRWGALPEEMKFAGCAPTIKFALGENVKQANWGDRFRTRYPQTRMGVEQLLRDAFRAAIEYRGRWVEWRSTKRGPPPRTDLELEALAEVVFGQRFIHCHSYRQDEILATLRVCEQFNVRIAVLHHILEGYKVADAMAKHGAAGSSFSDWWAYKFEVLDAIPYNGALMFQNKVNVTFNSDDAELGRRMNLEAAKAVKYGNVPESEALKFVTINAARQLGIDAKVGSIEVGKDADLVVWSESPLSSYTRAEQTWIDGRPYFTLAADEERRAEVQRRRAALIQRVLTSGEATESSDDSAKKKTQYLPRTDLFCPHCGRAGIGYQ
ncbi:MAG: amidohydrolase family protein [Planctomycetaceae bacterium]|nr:amidohydrolase family protein [Planctomycetaceae bacterium]